MSLQSFTNTATNMLTTGQNIVSDFEDAGTMMKARQQQSMDLRTAVDNNNRHNQVMNLQKSYTNSNSTLQDLIRST